MEIKSWEVLGWGWAELGAGAAAGAQPSCADTIAGAGATASHQRGLSRLCSCSWEYVGPCCLSSVGQVPSSLPSSLFLPSAPATQWEMPSRAAPARPSVHRA